MPPHLGQHITWPEAVYIAVYIAHSSMTVTPQFHHLSTSVCPHWDGSSWAGIMSHSFISITPMQICWTLLLRLRQMRWEAEPSRPTCVHPRHSFSQPPPAKFRSRRFTSLGCRRDGGRASSAETGCA